MQEINFNGIFETKNPEEFLNQIKEVMEKTETSFIGKVLKFVVDDYTEYTEINEETSN